MIDITEIVIALIGLATTIITTILVPYLKKKWDNEKLDEMYRWVTVGVEAAEQIFVGTGLGEKKKEYVLNFLAEKGYKVDAVEIDAAIEAVVLEMNRSIAE